MPATPLLPRTSASSAPARKLLPRCLLAALCFPLAAVAQQQAPDAGMDTGMDAKTLDTVEV
ncbi:MAG: hypothetical protein ACRDRQ_20390, partial [Pseudonocardiaceae bacterium]